MSPTCHLALHTEILQLISMHSMPGIPDIRGIPDMPEAAVLMTPDTVEVGGIAMVMEPMESIVDS